MSYDNQPRRPPLVRLASARPAAPVDEDQLSPPGWACRGGWRQGSRRCATATWNGSSWTSFQRNLRLPDVARHARPSLPHRSRLSTARSRPLPSPSDGFYHSFEDAVGKDREHRRVSWRPAGVTVIRFGVQDSWPDMVQRHAWPFGASMPYAIGSLVHARGREWVVLAGDDAGFPGAAPAGRHGPGGRRRLSTAGRRRRAPGGLRFARPGPPRRFPFLPTAA